MEKLYSNIKYYRKLLKMSQTALADKMGYSDKSMISKIENGKVDISLSTILKLADVFGVSPDVLMGFGSEIDQAYNRASRDTKQAVCAVLGIRRERD